MATISSIGSGARTYSTISSWLAAFASGGWEGECYNDSEFVGASAINFSGHATSSSNYIILRPASGQGFRDNGSASSNALKYNQSNGVGIRQTNNYNNTITISESWVTLLGLQIKNDGSNGNRTLSGAASLSSVIVDSCILDFAGSNPSVASAVIASGTITNCLIITRSTSGDGLYFGYPTGTPTAANCTIVRPSNITAAGNGITSSSGNWKAFNCAVFGFTTFNSGGTPTGCSNNASDVAIGIGSSNQASKTYTSQFQGTTSSAQDFRAKAGADLLENATSTGAPSVDIINTSRPRGSAYDIGCWELVTGGASFKPGWALNATRMVSGG
jgi:hypothetical protein